MSWAARIGIGIVVLLILGVVAVGFYAGTLKPPHQTYEQVVPNDRIKG